MISAASLLLVGAPAAVALFLAAFFALEILGAFLPGRRPQADHPRPEKIAVVIPAHNEGEGVLPTIADLKAQLKAGDRLIVVADNCEDRTADFARKAGAEVLERCDPERRGKGYALQFAIDALRDDPPAVVFFIDADCRLGEGALARTAAAALAADRPAQALYLMQAPKGAGPKARVAEFAWRVMNEARMGGLYRLFDVTRLTGAGMATPWTLAAELSVGSGEIVEDLALSLDLTRRGAAPIFVADALVTSEFPTTEEAAAKQRARWEHGSLSLARRRVAGLFGAALVRRDARLAALAFDIAIPPLTIFAASLVAVFLVSLAAAALGVLAPLAMAFAAMALFGAGLLAAWIKVGGKGPPASGLRDLADYAAGKTRVYGAEARRSTKTWTRTARDGGEAATKPSNESPPAQSGHGEGLAEN